MKKKDNPMGRLFWIVVLITFIFAEVIGRMNGLDPIDKSQFVRCCIGFVSMIYGIIYYIVKKWHK